MPMADPHPATAERPRGTSGRCIRTANSDATSAPSRVFWKAGKYDSARGIGDALALVTADGLMRPISHPKSLHSNATVHKWPLGAVAELIDNSYEQTTKVSTPVHVHIDVKPGAADGVGPMLVVRTNRHLPPRRLSGPGLPLTGLRAPWASAVAASGA